MLGQLDIHMQKMKLDPVLGSPKTTTMFRYLLEGHGLSKSYIND